MKPPFLRPTSLEMKAEFRRECSRRHEVRAAEGRKKVVKSNFVRYVDGGDAQAPLVAVTMKQIVLPRSNVKQIAWRDARRIVIIVFRSVRRNYDTRCAMGGARS